MKKLVLTSLIAANVLACPDWAPCLVIENANEELMVHDYSDEGAYIAKQNQYLPPSLIDLARPMIGIPYRFGGENQNGIDCSAFSRKLYKNLGVYLPRTSRSQYRDERFQEVSFDHLQPWDLIYFKKSNLHPISHVAIYLGDAKIIHSSKKEGGVYISNFYKGSYWSEIAFAAKRLKGEYK